MRIAKAGHRQQAGEPFAGSRGTGSRLTSASVESTMQAARGLAASDDTRKRGAMLILTNREVDASQVDESAFLPRFKPGADRIGFAAVARATRGPHWVLSQVTAGASDAVVLAALTAVFAGRRPVLVHVHGNNMTPAECFERCTRLQEIYKGRPSKRLSARQRRLEDEWTLEDVTPANYFLASIRGVIKRYRQAKRNGTDSAAALARFFGLLAQARAAAGSPPHSVAAHSLCAHCLMEMLAYRGAAATLSTATNIAMLAACVPTDGHARWLSRLTLSGLLLIAYNVTDPVLLGAWYADRFDEKLGVKPMPPLVSSKARYVDFKVQAPFDHEYFVAETGYSVAPRVRRVMARVFGSQPDIQGKEDPCDIYRGCCDPQRLVCGMA
jgi:hypothetical protein